MRMRRVLLEEGNYRQALRALVVVIQSEPEDTAPYQDYAQALLAVGEGTKDAAESIGCILRTLTNCKESPGIVLIGSGIFWLGLNNDNQSL